ncbi:MAG: hypothetical protein LBO00_08075 [Zoogloeaceae bacterium]|jgi:hypothetical protein|nr:hypothetical protein [Zoogloeaceae bacterium]
MDALTLPGNASDGTGFVFLLLLLIACAFLIRFVLPALLLLRDLRRAVRALERLQTSDPESIARQVMTSPRLARLWREYAQTLHPPETASSADGNAGRNVAVRRTRKTVAAGQFFNLATLVETPLKTEFYKHLPGILTGIGIIGTFAGLIAGLTHFEVNSDTDTVRLSLKHLIQGVGHAFQVSALAITLAMLATWIEKSFTTLGERLVARLAELIDARFEGGVEEEYLARLVAASETSAAQGEQLRAALAQELRQGLAELLRQQQAQAAAERQEMAASMARAVAHAVSESLRAPLSRMATALETAGSGQGAAIGQTLAPLLDKLAARMEASMARSGQSGQEILLVRAAESLNRVVSDLSGLTARLATMSQGAVANVAGELQTAGQGVGRAADTFTSASRQILEAAASLGGAAREAGDILREQSACRDALAQMLPELREIIGNARREAALTTELVTRMEAAGSALGQAGLEAGNYLDGVSQVLAEAHARFAENMERTLREGNAQFHRELATAVDYLRGAIETLGDTLETLASRK